MLKLNLSICPVTPENRAQVEGLEVFPEQIHYIETVRACLEEADTLRDWEPVCILDGETLIGFAMYGLIHEGPAPRVWFDRFLIDWHYQHRGCGRQAVELLLQHLRTKFPGHDIYLSAFPENRTAIALYRSFGFENNGELDINGEDVMVLRA